MLVEGNSLRATARMADVSRNTVDKLLCDVGAACQEYQDKHLRNLPCKRVQCDEIWSFVYSKDKNVPEDKQGEWGYGESVFFGLQAFIKEYLVKPITLEDINEAEEIILAHGEPFKK